MNLQFRQVFRILSFSLTDSESGKKKILKKIDEIASYGGEEEIKGHSSLQKKKNENSVQIIGE